MVNEQNSNVVLENRNKITVTGVIDMNSFDDINVTIDTELGIIYIKGQDLHINRLNIENGEIIIDGNIDSIIYSDEHFKKDKTSLLTRLFK